MKHMPQAFQAALSARHALKAIAGIANFDADRVAAIVRAAEAGGAHAVDVAASTEVVKAAKANTRLTVFVSSTDPVALEAAAEAGADVLELGNYDALYLAGHSPSADEILGWAQETLRRVGRSVPLCATVSGRLPVAEQVALAKALEAAGVTMLQTEGQVGPEANDPFAALAAATSALGNTVHIREAVSLPLMLAGGFNHVSAPFAIASGADALGVGKAIVAAGGELEMAEATRRIAAALAAVHTPHLATTK